MKTLTKILFTAAVSAAATCLTINTASAQTLLAGWAVNSITGVQTNSTTFAATTANLNLVVGPLTKGFGISPVATTGVFGGNNWTNSGGTGTNDTEDYSITGGHYITYTIQANPGYTVSFSTNILYWHNSATGPWNGELQYSTDGINYTNIAFLPYNTTNASTTSSITNNLSGIAALQNVPATTTNFFRLVNWGATGSAGTWYVNNASPTTMPDFQVLGSATPVPAAENLATWWVNLQTNLPPPNPFTNNTADVNLIVGPMMKGFGIGEPSGTEEYGGNNWTNDVVGGSGATDTESNAIAGGHYITYSLQAAPGYTVSFFTNFLYYHASGTGPSHGELQYSTDGVDYVDLEPMSYSGTALLTNNLSTIQFLQNVPSTVTNYFRIVNWGATGGTGTWYIYDNPPVGTNGFVVNGGLYSLYGIVAPTNLMVTPSSITANAGQTVSFTAQASGSPATNFWYQLEGSTPVLIPWATTSTLTLTNVLGTNSGSYFVVLTNSSGSATSSVVTLDVLNDPGIQVEPSSAQGLLDGTVQFGVTAFGTQPISYQWYYSDTFGDLLGPVANVTQLDGSVISGATNSVLSIANVQPDDLTNFVVVVTNVYGSVTSSVASLLSVTNVGGVLALWDFDGPQFTNTAANPNSINNPAPFIGFGTALAVGTCYNPGTSPFSGATDPGDVSGVFSPYGFAQPAPNFSWGTEDYPVVGTNKQNGVQFNISTVGARNIRVAYDGRVSSTASDYFRLQYTTNGIDWIDYPASSTFSGLSGSGNAGFYPFDYNLTGFPGVDNNPNFGIRVVSEFANTATYGISTTTNWVGTANSYSSGASGNNAAGTVTYDLVAIQGDAITNNNQPPVMSSFLNTNMVDTNTLVLNFSASDPEMPASDLTFNVQSLNTVAAGTFIPTVQPNFAVNNVGSTNFTLSISFPDGYIPDPEDAAPILVTATDTNGESVAGWFVLTVQSINLPPTNSLTGLTGTNTLVNQPVTIPFMVGDDRTPVSGLTYSVSSDNNTVIPAANIVIGNQGTTNPSVTITPATGQVGNAMISVTVYDNDPAEPRSTTANIAFTVKPNTNIVAIDYFNYDNSGSLDVIASNYWQRLSGIVGQLQVGGGVATVSDENTENLQAKLLASPYKTNTGAVLYSSFVVNMSSSVMPTGDGSYFTAFNDGSGNTADVEDCLVAATNGAAPGYYRLGIANVVGATAQSAQMFPQDLTPGVNYTVITSLSVTNGYSTLWVSPTNQASLSVTDYTPPASPTNLYNISEFELRESGTVEGQITVGNLLVGTTFDSVFYPPQANPDTFSVAENSTGDLLSPLPNDAGSDLSLVSVSPTNGTAAISGTNVSFTPVNDFIGTATIGYTIMDDMGEMSNAVISVIVTNIPPLANPDTYSVPENSVNNVLSPLTNDVVETSGGTLSLVSATETDGNGTISTSGNNVLFTPTANFVGTATIDYAVTDNVGGTNSSIITVNVGTLTPIPVNATVIAGGRLVLSWSNPAFSLETSTNVTGPYVVVPGATSPYTNMIGTNAAAFFRLMH